MEDGEKQKNLEKNVSRKPFSTISNDSSILQSFWVRCGSIFSNIKNREFMEGELRVVLCCGSIFWIIYLLS
jgi:hypothetical protein